jgi:hypothetical protein
LAVFSRFTFIASECVSKDLLLHEPAQYCDGVASAIKTGLLNLGSVYIDILKSVCRTTHNTLILLAFLKHVVE